MPPTAASIAAVVADAVDVSNGTAGVVTCAGTGRATRPGPHHRRHAGDPEAAGLLAVASRSPKKSRIPAIFDMMMRPGSADHVLEFRSSRRTRCRRRRLSAKAVVRTDRKGVRFPLDIIAGHLGLFAEGRAKELLITPNGVRIVWLLAEADRARYGVFRQAEFPRRLLDPALIETLLRGIPLRALSIAERRDATDSRRIGRRMNAATAPANPYLVLAAAIVSRQRPRPAGLPAAACSSCSSWSSWPGSPPNSRRPMRASSAATPAASDLCAVGSRCL